MTTIEQLKSLIRVCPDFPKPGIMFRDITPLLGNGPAFAKSIDLLVEAVQEWNPEAIIAIESRGFIFGAAVAKALRIGFVPVRKPGKLPFDKVAVTYDLEYGTDTLAIHQDALKPNMRAVIVDDLLATGGTAGAALRLVASIGAQVVGSAFLIELAALEGRKRLMGIPVKSLIQY